MRKKEQVVNQEKVYFFYGKRGKNQITLGGIVNPKDNTKMTIGLAQCHKNDVFKKEKARMIVTGRAVTHLENRDNRENESMQININPKNPGREFSAFAQAYCD
jgi:glucan-binding YG repeat protein